MGNSDARFPSPLVGEGPFAKRRRVSDYLKSQVALAYWARASRAFALRRPSSLWARAILTAILCFPAASNLSRQAARGLSYLAAGPAIPRREWRERGGA